MNEVKLCNSIQIQRSVQTIVTPIMRAACFFFVGRAGFCDSPVMEGLPSECFTFLFRRQLCVVEILILKRHNRSGCSLFQLLNENAKL